VSIYGGSAQLTRSFARTDEQGRRLPPTLRFYTRLEATISQILVPLLGAEGTGSGGADQMTMTGDQTQAAKLSVGVVWDRRYGFEAAAYRDLSQAPINPAMPVRGFLLSAQVTLALCCSFAPFSADGSFIAFTGQAIGLKPFGPTLRAEDGWPFGMQRFSFNANLRFNYGQPFKLPALPAVERFYAGGDTTTRGYDTDALKSEEVRSPLGPLGGETAYRVVPQGGNIRLLSQLEWQFAIAPKLLVPGWPWVGALFL